jgi:hypothetical protein
LDYGQLAVEKFPASGGLDRQRIAVPRRPAAEDVENVHVLSPHFHAFDDNVGEQLPCPADKRLTQSVFVGPRGLAAED